MFMPHDEKVEDSYDLGVYNPDVAGAAELKKLDTNKDGAVDLNEAKAHFVEVDFPDEVRTTLCATAASSSFPCLTHLSAQCNPDVMLFLLRARSM